MLRREGVIDVGVGAAMVREPKRPVRRAKPQQFAEKVHAYSFPWADRVNTRTKDLVDLVLLIERGLPDVEQIRAALAATFETRGTHALPKALAGPPPTWEMDFSGMAEEAGISTRDYLAAFAILDRFWTLHV